MEDNKDMKDEKLLNILCQERMASALELSLKSCERYKDAEREADKKMEYVFELGLDNKQKYAIDQAFTAYNYSNAEYGKAAYLQGFRDGINLIKEIYEI
jgi:hypothetical protein